MGKATSATKIAKMAQKGRGKRVRFQNGTLFPAIVALIVALGLALIVYARSSSYANADGPRASARDHWHLSYGFYHCDTWLPNLVGNKEEVSQYRSYGVHSHDDGVIHYHPFSGAASGRNAKLKRFLEVYDVQLSDDKLTLPADQGGLVLEEGVTKCKDADGKEVDGELKVAVFDDALDPTKFNILTANADDARITRNGMAFTIAFVPKDVDIPIPPTATELDALGAVDSNVTDTTIATVSSENVGTTVAPGTTAGSATTAPGSTAAAPTTAAPTTTG